MGLVYLMFNNFFVGKISGDSGYGTATGSIVTGSITTDTDTTCSGTHITA